MANVSAALQQGVPLFLYCAYNYEALLEALITDFRGLHYEAHAYDVRLCCKLSSVGKVPALTLQTLQCRSKF
jgi:hypothetical protein